MREYVGYRVAAEKRGNREWPLLHYCRAPASSSQVMTLKQRQSNDDYMTLFPQPYHDTWTLHLQQIVPRPMLNKRNRPKELELIHRSSEICSIMRRSTHSHQLRRFGSIRIAHIREDMSVLGWVIRLSDRADCLIWREMDRYSRAHVFI